MEQTRRTTGAEGQREREMGGRGKRGGGRGGGLGFGSQPLIISPLIFWLSLSAAFYWAGGGRGTRETG